MVDISFLNGMADMINESRHSTIQNLAKEEDRMLVISRNIRITTDLCLYFSMQIVYLCKIVIIQIK